METAAIIQLIAIMLPVAQKAGIDIYAITQELNTGKTTEQLIAELEAKRNDLEELPFK